MSYKKKSNKQEKDVAKDVKGKTTIASGSLWFQKADVKNDRFLFECKITEKDYFTITSKIWGKLEKQAIKNGLREPVLVIDFKDGLYRYAVISLSTLYNLNLEQKDIMIVDLIKLDKDSFETKSFKLNHLKIKEIELEVIEIKNKILIYTFRLDENILCVLEWEDFIYSINKGGN